MLINNFKKLASTPERKMALEVANAGLESAMPNIVIQENVSLKNNFLTIKDEKYDLSRIENLYVIGFGKAAFETGQALEKILKDKITEGIVLDINKGKLKYLQSFKGTHPLPSDENLSISKKIVAIAKKATKDDLIIALISGGASALFCLPHELSIDQLKSLNDELIKSGADIQEINTVRKHISKVKGGGLAEIAYPAKVVSIIFSDVPGNDLSFIASGPTVVDKTVERDVARVLKKYDIEDDFEVFETPKDTKYFKNIDNILLLSGITAVERMQAKCKELKQPCAVYSYALRGEAKIVGRKLLQRLPDQGFMVAAGETTVKVEGDGKGGRNQELVLGAMPYLEDTVFISLASDGMDNTDAAGAIADEISLKKAQEKDMDWAEYINDNDSYNFFKKAGGLIMTGPTGTNIADIIVIYKK